MFIGYFEEEQAMIEFMIVLVLIFSHQSLECSQKTKNPSFFNEGFLKKGGDPIRLGGELRRTYENKESLS